MKLTKKQKEQEKVEAITKLRKMLNLGQTVYTNLKSVSSSGMSRKISVYIVEEVDTFKGKENVINDITWLVARALDMRRDPKTGGLIVQGGGMDMGFHVVYNLSHTVFKNDISSPKDSGYVLRQTWL